MGVLIDQLTAKFAEADPPLDVAAGIRQESQLDFAGQLSFATVDEMDAFVMERLIAREGEALTALNTAVAPRYYYPFPPEQLPNIYPAHTDEQRTAIVQFQKQTAAEAVEKWVLGDLYLKASHRDPAYSEKALFYLGGGGRKGDAETTLDRALASVGAAAQGVSLTNIKSNVLRTGSLTRGEPADRDEYRGPDYCGWGSGGGLERCC